MQEQLGTIMKQEEIGFRHERATVLTVCVLLSCIAAVVIVFLNGWYIGATKAYINHSEVMPVLEKIDRIVIYLHWFQSICALMGWICLIGWMAQLARNLRTLNKSTKTGVRTAFVYALIPVFNLFSPPLFVRRIWKEQDLKPPTLLIVGWWLSWVFVCFLRASWNTSQSYFIDNSANYTLEKMLSLYALDSWGQILSFVPAFLFLALISKTNRMQSKIWVNQSGRHSDEIKPDLLLRLLSFTMGLGVFAYYLAGFVAWVMSAHFAFKTFEGWWWVVVLFGGPISAFLIPWYAAFAKGNWSLVLVSYGSGILYTIFASVAAAVTTWIYGDDMEI